MARKKKAKPLVEHPDRDARGCVEKENMKAKARRQELTTKFPSEHEYLRVTERMPAEAMLSFVPSEDLIPLDEEWKNPNAPYLTATHELKSQTEKVDALDECHVSVIHAYSHAPVTLVYLHHCPLELADWINENMDASSDNPLVEVEDCQIAYGAHGDYVQEQLWKLWCQCPEGLRSIRSRP